MLSRADGLFSKLNYVEAVNFKSFQKSYKSFSSLTGIHILIIVFVGKIGGLKMKFLADIILGTFEFFRK